jgi:hypothetical protein
MAMGNMTAEEAKRMASEIEGAEALDIVNLPSDMRRVVQLVQAAASQLRIVARPMGPPVCLGFDYPAVELAAKWLGIEIDAPMFRDLREIEVEAVQIMREAA